jgi:tetratricopeptide (TPR) repeat protein
MREMKSIDKMKMDIKTIIYLVMLCAILTLAVYSLKIGSIRIYEFLFFVVGSSVFVIWNLKDRVKSITSNINSVIEAAEKAAKAGEWQKAVTAYDELLAARPNELKALVRRAECYKHLAGYREAIHEFKKIIDIHPKEAEPHYFLGTCYFDGRFTEEALDEFEICVSIDPDFADAHRYLGDIHKLNRNREKAIEHYDIYIQKGKDGKTLESVKEKIRSLRKQ